MHALIDIQSLIAHAVGVASITIRNLDDDLKARLRVRAAERGRSMEEEAREIIRCALSASSRRAQNLATAIRRRFAAVGGVELPVVTRDPPRDPPLLR
jgi:plasmid stability protein